MSERQLRPADLKELEKASNQWVDDQKKVLRDQGVPEDVIASRFSKQATFSRGSSNDGYKKDIADMRREAASDSQSSSNESQDHFDPKVPDSFDPSAVGLKPVEQKKRHPLLVRLEKEFGISKLNTKVVALGGYTFTFRPKSYRDYEWMTNNIPPTPENKVAVSSFQVTSVASGLAAINDVPIYELFDIDVTGRFIPNKNYPPPDIREAAQNILLQWFRDDVGLWELIPALDVAYSEVFDKEKDASYPLKGLLEKMQVVQQTEENAS